jgi:hypothetical protein
MPSTLCPSFWANSVLKLICLVVGCDKFTTNPFFTSKYSSYMFQIFDQDRILIQCQVISWSWPHFSRPKIEGEVSPHKQCVLFSGVCQQWQCVKIVRVLVWLAFCVHCGCSMFNVMQMGHPALYHT